jgi:hypothetical protein
MEPIMAHPFSLFCVEPIMAHWMTAKNGINPKINSGINAVLYSGVYFFWSPKMPRPRKVLAKTLKIVVFLLNFVSFFTKFSINSKVYAHIPPNKHPWFKALSGRLDCYAS